MKSNIFKIGILLLSLGLATSCVNSDEYSNPNLDCVDPGLTANKTVAALKSEVLARGANATVPTRYTTTTNDIIEGYVTSNDEKGNFYKVVYLQTKPTDGSLPIGFSLPLDVTTSFGEGFYPGRKIYVKLEGLYTAMVDGILSIGGIYQPNPNVAAEIGRINDTEWKRYLFPSCDVVSEAELVHPVPFATAFADQYQGLLIDIQNVQFSDSSLGRTLYDVDSGGGATNQLIESATIPQTGGQKYIRFSSFASFYNQPVPEGSGTIRGVLTRYQSDFQFLIRSTSDFDLNGPRVDGFPPKVGNAIVYPATFNENFESYATSSSYAGINFPKYVNDPAIGGRYWDIRTFSSNKYAFMSSFGSGGSNKSYLVFPVTMTAGYKFSFKTLTGYYNGNPMKVYYSTDYTPGGIMSQATLVDISNNFAYSVGPSNTYATSFTNSGDYIIPATLSGNGYFIFEYSGQDDTGITTNVEIDDVKLVP
ncbi:DUF5689 domain-containing protein [Flavobacterium silvaticum]|uniref:DUF5689 domain-containing protein n=1 Tax=Flavobacterium silvaticum TaxID=1852020 RepID=A0A972JGZ8_9FLAO|nr:DUF5689 domain-containing protein [Flavobacterium silvaticum]NMH26593.1 hypothetical protein [Flavobacterium silvaticum]